MTRGSGPTGGASWDDFSPPAGGPLHSLDARLRVLLAVLLAIFVVWCDRPEVLAANLLLAAVLALAARLPLRDTLLRLLLLDLFMLLLVVTLPFSFPGETLFTLGSLEASREGTWQALSIALKANSVLLIMLSLPGTLETVALGHALHHLRVPDKLVRLLLFTVRYIDLLRGEYGRLRAAMRVRAFRPRADRHTWRALGYLVGMLLVRSLERSERILAAMRCRGFEGRFHRYTHPPATHFDLWAVLSTGLLLTLLGVWELGA